MAQLWGSTIGCNSIILSVVVIWITVATSSLAEGTITNICQINLTAKEACCSLKVQKLRFQSFYNDFAVECCPNLRVLIQSLKAEFGRLEVV